ncbi:fatty acid desaturase family protein [Tautonia sociabilis]|nr:fatty acid desaturase [Tautonia sociabilis]
MSRRPTFNAPGLRDRVKALRQVDNARSLACLAREYACLAAVIGGAVLFVESREAWGLSRWWNVPVIAAAIVLVGALQHRLAGIAHEASHFALLREKRVNDLAADLFCLFPLLSTIHFYRVFHLAHHQYTNDPDRDPDLQNLGPGKRSEEFPMPRARLLVTIYLAPLSAPLAFLRYQWAYVAVTILGIGKNVYVDRAGGGEGRAPLRRGTALGLSYVIGLVAALWVLHAVGRTAWLPAAGAIGLGAALAVLAMLPARALYRSPLRQPYGTRAAAAARLAYLTAAIVALGLLTAETGGKAAGYGMLLWFVPMGTSFMYFMYLRDVYQHSNADAGPLTNSRVFFCDPFSRWAVFVYGQGMHVPHHLFPAIPHHQLPRLHQLLMREHPDYARQVVECHGTFANRNGRPTILDVLTTPPADEWAGPRPLG